MRQPGHERDGGYILVAVLAVLALLALFVGAVALLARPATETARLAGQSVVDDGLVQAGVELAAYQLFALGLRADQIDSRRIRMDDGVITLFVEAEGGKVDLNGASPALLASAFRAARRAGMTPETFADRVVDWRDRDDDRSPHGAESRDYRGAGLAYGPANTAFRSVAELRWVLGLGTADVAALLPWMTIYNPGGKIVAAEAPRSVLLALPGMTAAKADRILEIRTGKSDESERRIADLLGAASRDAQAGPVPSYSVTIEVSRGTTIAKSVRAVLIAPPSGTELYRVADWTDLPRSSRVERITRDTGATSIPE